MMGHKQRFQTALLVLVFVCTSTVCHADMTLAKGEHLHVLGIPRVNLNEVFAITLRTAQMRSTLSCHMR